MQQQPSAAISVDMEKQHEPDTQPGHRPISEKQSGPAPSTAVQQASESVNPFHPSQFPDGGMKAYLCLLGGFCAMFCSFGWLNCLGVFQNYYQMNQLRDYSPSTIAWIPSVMIFIMFLPGPIVGWANDNYGPKYLLVFGTFFHVLGLMMTSLCSEYYQLFLAQAVCSPLGLNCLFQAATTTIPTWFLNKRGLAYGIMAAGSGLGGIIFPIMASHLIPKVGFGWAMRIIAFMILGLCLVATVTVTSRLPPRPRAFELKVFVGPLKDTRFNLLTASSFFFFLGLFIPINFIEVQAVEGGMSTHLAGYILSVLNAGSIFGRIIPGALADKFGKFNMQALWCSLSGILILALGLPANSNAAFLTFAALYGFASGAWVSLAPAQMAQISKVDEIGVRVGISFAIVSFAGLIGSPIAGAIVDATNGAYWGVNVFAGVACMTGAVLYTFTRMYIADWKFVTIV